MNVSQDKSSGRWYVVDSNGDRLRGPYLGEDEARAAARYITPDADSARFVLWAMCECTTCAGTGKEFRADPNRGVLKRDRVAYVRCVDCRGEGRTRREVASATDEQSLGLALVTCAREGEWSECLGFGLLDREGVTGQKWLVRPWLPSSRNVSDAARTLAKSKTKEKT